MEPRTITFGRRAWIALAVFAALMIGLLAGQVVIATGQIEHIDRQRDVAEAQRRTVLDLLAGGRELAGRLDDQIPAVRRGARDAAGLVRESQPLVEDLNRFDAGRAIAAAGALAARAEQLDTLGGIEALRADTDRLRALTEEAVRMQRELLAIQERTIAVLEESLAVQRETLTHTRSIDRKTGGTVPGG